MIMPVPVPVPVWLQLSGVKTSLKVIVVLPQLSDPVAMPVASGNVDIPHSTLASGGQTMLGGVVSTIVMIWVQLVVNPQLSVAVQVRVMVPVLPQAGSKLSLKVMFTPPQLSDPVAIPVASGEVDIPHSTVASGGHTMVGGVVSSIVII